jgi:hypothetical protein
MLDVPDVELDALVPRQGRAPVDLRPARDPRLDLEPAPLTRRVLLDLVAQRRPRPDHAHVAAQDVPQLWKLVERQASQNAARAGDPSVALVDREAGALVLRADHHRPQLQQVEVDAVLADAALPVQHGAAVLELDRDRSSREQRGRDDEGGACDGKVCRTIHDVGITRRVVPPLIALALAAVVLAATLRPAGWDVTSLPRVASNTQLGVIARGIDPGFEVVHRSDYDGQFYWAVAVDPLATGKAHHGVDKPTYRYGHPLLGWLAWLLSGGQAGAAAAALLAACLLSLAAAAFLAGELGGLGAAAFTVFSPGLLYSAVHGLAEPLVVALVLGALLARRPYALACCALAPLAKEQLVVVPIVFALWEIRRPRRAAMWLAMLLPAIGWWVYARIHLGAWFTTGDTALGAPFGGWRRAIVDAGVYATSGVDEMRLLVLVALVGLLATAAIFAARTHRRIDAVYLVLAAIAACLAANATESLRDALRNTALLVALVPFVLGPAARELGVRK